MDLPSPPSTRWLRASGRGAACCLLAAFGACGAVVGPRDAAVAEDAASDGAPASDAAPADAAAPDAPPPCEGTTACLLSTGAAVTAGCEDGDPSGTCVDPDWDYCSCGGGGGRAFFFDPPSGAASTRITFIAEAGLLNLTLSVDGICPGSTQSACPLDAGGCAGAGWAAYVWTWDLAPGPHTITIYAGDVGAPCWTDDGGAVLLQVSFTR